MRVRSSFKDYYDFVAGKYGGGDPNIVYERIKEKYDAETGGFRLAVEIHSCILPDPFRLGYVNTNLIF